MKFSDFTITVLKNFSNVNQGVVLKPGTFQRTMSADKTFMIEVDFEETFTHKFGIYDLNQFIGNISAMDDPELTFTDKMVVIEDSTFKLNYHACDPELIASPGDKQLPDDFDVKFNLPKSSLNKILTLASLNDLPNISVVGENGELLMIAHDKNNSSSIKASSRISDFDGEDFSATLKMKNLRILPDDYTVSILKDKYAKFSSCNHKLTYFAGLETK